MKPLVVTDGAWEERTSYDEMDGDKLIMVSLQSENRIVGFGGAESKPDLVFRCKKRKLEAFVLTNTPARGDYDGHPVRLKYDSAKPVEQSWSGAVNSKSLFSPRPWDLADKLTKTEYFRFEFTPLAHNPEVVVFKTRGFSRQRFALQECLAHKPAKRAVRQEEEESDDLF